MSPDRGSAQRAARACLASGQAATAAVQEAELVVAASALAPRYQRIGCRWQARLAGNGTIRWHPGTAIAASWAPHPRGHDSRRTDSVNPQAASPADLIDVTRPHPARMYDYYLNGKDNWQADRDAAARVLAVAPEVRAIARANRAFMHRAVRHLAAVHGITQFLDVGTGIPTSPNVHEVAAVHAPGARTVYADNDPVVHAHANALLTGDGATRVILADLRDPGAVIAGAGNFLDFTRPVALLLIAVLHFIPDSGDPAGIVASLRGALPPGSWLALSHGTADFHPAGIAATAAAAYDHAPAPLVLRPRDQVEALFGGFTLEDPGLVPAPLWRPEGRPRRPRDMRKAGIYAGVAARN